MSDLRYILLLGFLLPAMSLAQTVPVSEEKIVYKGKIKIPENSPGNAYDLAKSLLLNVMNANPDSLKEVKQESVITGSANIRLSSPYYLINQVHYKIKLQAKDNVIGYEIGDIELKLRERGKKPKTISSADLLKGIQENGKVATQAEKYLNEIDMNIQKLIAQMKKN
jgi:hypothetical protein